MSRSFDGVNDGLRIAAHATINNLNPQTLLFWTVRRDGGPDVAIITEKRAPDGWQLNYERAVGNTGSFRFIHDRTGVGSVDGDWSTAMNTAPPNVFHHFACAYNDADAANDPDIYIDGVLLAVAELLPPVGAAASDAASQVSIGEASNDVSPYDGVIGWYTYVSSFFTAGEVNRHRWWGMSPGGPSTVAVWHPLWAEADPSPNKGTATASTTLSDVPGMASLPRTERMYGSMMGCGR